jgi:hypothetical protein
MVLRWSCGGPGMDRAAGRGVCRPAAGVPGCSLPLSGVCRGPSLIPPLTWPDAAPGPSRVHRRTIPGPPQVHPGSMPSQAPGSRQKKSFPRWMILAAGDHGACPGRAGAGAGTSARPLPGAGSPSCGWVPPLTARPPRRGDRQRAARRGRPGRSPGRLPGVTGDRHGPMPRRRCSGIGALVTLVRARRVAATRAGAWSRGGAAAPSRGPGHRQRACAPLTSRGGPGCRHGEAVSAARASSRVASTGSGRPGRAGGRSRTRCRPGPGSPAHRRGTGARPASGAGAI